TARTPVTKLLRRGSAGDVPAGALRDGDLVVLEWRLFEPLELRRVRREVEVADVRLDERTLALRLAGPALADVVRVTASAGALSASGRVRGGSVELTLPPAQGLTNARRSLTWNVVGR